MKKEIKETDKWAGKTLRPKKNVYRKRLAQKNKWLLGLAHVPNKKLMKKNTNRLNCWARPM